MSDFPVLRDAFSQQETNAPPPPAHKILICMQSTDKGLGRWVGWFFHDEERELDRALIVAGMVIDAVLLYHQPTPPAALCFTTVSQPARYR